MSKELKTGTGAPVGQADPKSHIKTVKILFRSITQEPPGPPKPNATSSPPENPLQDALSIPQEVPITRRCRTKHANHWLGVQNPLKGWKILHINPNKIHITLK